MKTDLIMSLAGVWYSRRGDAWFVSPERPVLSRPCRILTDFDGAPAGVMAVDAKPEFSAAVIEKRVRTEGLVDGESHILAHRLISAGGSCRVFYTAVPLASWNATHAWLAGQSSTGLVFSLESAMLALTRRHAAVICRSGRQFRFLVSAADTLNYVSTTAFSDDPDDLDIALISLIERAGPKALPDNAQASVFWCDLLAPENDDGVRLHNLLAQRMRVSVRAAPANIFALATEAGQGGASGELRLRSALETLADAVSWRCAANAPGERISAVFDQYRLAVAAVVALIGLGLIFVTALWYQQAVQMREQAGRLNAEATAISQRIAGQDAPHAQVLAPYAPTIAFLDRLRQAADGPDPLAVLAHVRQAAERRVRVMRVQLIAPDGAFRIDGMPLNGVDTGVALAGFLDALKMNGYGLSAEDPGNQSQLPGFFSYSLRSLRRAADSDGAGS